MVVQCGRWIWDKGLRELWLGCKNLRYSHCVDSGPFESSQARCRTSQPRIVFGMRLGSCSGS